MILTLTVKFECIPVSRSAITFVVTPVIIGELLVQFLHVLIAVCFGEYAGCCNGSI
jgi:hypothetical protein